MRTFAQKRKPTHETKSAGSARIGRIVSGRTREANSILDLQRTIGNQAMQRLLQTQSNDLEVGFGPQAAVRFAHDFSLISLHPKSAVKIQAKLTVDTPGDIYEQEADRISDRVTCMSTPQLQRAGACGEGYPKCQTEQPSQERERLRTQRVQSNDLGQIAAPHIIHDVLSSPSRPLDPATRELMEPRFGHDFRGVRVHTDAKAAESAQAIGAAAYTVGQEVVFGAGRYAPGTAEGRRLLAHELTHVVQQASAATPRLQCQPDRNDVTDLELELQSKLSERALLARLLEDLQKKSAADVYERRVNTGAQKEQAKLKAGAQGDLQRLVPVDVLKNKIEVVRGKGGFTLKVRIELSYPGLKDAEGRSKAATDIPRIEKTLREAWTIDLTEGRYAGNKFQLEPQIEFRPNARQHSDKALQFIVRRDAKGKTIAQWHLGEVSFNPEHLMGDRVVIAAHELYHLFGFIVDSYYIPEKTAKSGPGAKYSVGRADATGRGDLLGMVDPEKLREWRDSGVISQADFDRQTRAQVKVWQEDADRILYALGASPNTDKTGAQNDPNSPGFDPQAALRATEAKAKQRLADLQGATDRYAEIADSVQKAERAIQLDEEIAALQKKIAERKAAGAKGPTKP